MTTKALDRIGRNRTARLSPKQECAALELARGATYEEAAGRTEVAVSTVKLWVAKTPAFNARVDELRNRMTEDVLDVIRLGIGEAVRTAVRLMRDPDAGVAQRAMDSMLTHGLNAIEMSELKTQVDELGENR